MLQPPLILYLSFASSWTHR